MTKFTVFTISFCVMFYVLQIHKRVDHVIFNWDTDHEEGFIYGKCEDCTQPFLISNKDFSFIQRTNLFPFKYVITDSDEDKQMYVLWFTKLSRRIDKIIQQEKNEQ